VDEVQGQKGTGQGHRIDILLSISGSGFKVHWLFAERPKRPKLALPMVNLYSLKGLALSVLEIKQRLKNLTNGHSRPMVASRPHRRVVMS